MSVGIANESLLIQPCVLNVSLEFRIIHRMTRMTFLGSTVAVNFYKIGLRENMASWQDRKVDFPPLLIINP